MESLKAFRVENFKSKPLIVSATFTISEVIGVLQFNNAYEAFIQEGNKVSTITIRRILKASDISDMRASTLIFFTSKLSQEDTIGKAAKLMNDHRLRALPIVREGTIVGAVTAQSLCRALLSVRKFGDFRINKIMRRKLITINHNDSISKARRLMLKNSIDHLPVLDSGELCGILLSNHIVFSRLPKEGLEKGAFVSKPFRYLDVKASGLMDPNTLECDLKEKALTVLKKMIEQEKTYSVVKLWHELQGIVTYRDFLVLLEEEEKLDVPAYIVGLPDDPFEAELARRKFMKESKTLCMSFPKIEEIRSTIKTKEISDYRRRYEVNVLVISGGNGYSYSENGWDLPSIFDSITNKMKRLLTKKNLKRHKRK